jgi:hypothetical protein
MAAEGYTQVLCFRNLKYREHALAARDFAGSDNFFAQGVDSGGTRDQQQAETGLAAEPARPLKAAVVHRDLETMSCHGIIDETG